MLFHQKIKPAEKKNEWKWEESFWENGLQHNKKTYNGHYALYKQNITTLKYLGVNPDHIEMMYKCKRCINKKHIKVLYSMY